MTNTVQCACGMSNAIEQTFCSSCGKNMRAQTAGLCSKCGAPSVQDASFCGNCGARFVAPPAISPLQSSSYQTRASGALDKTEFYGLKEYYVDEFQRIRDTGESYKGKWNWAAFLFGAFWGLAKGLWLPSLIAIVGSIFTGGIVGAIYWFVFAARGNYMYYCKHMKQKDIPI